jgi:hypothetical protein
MQNYSALDSAIIKAFSEPVQIKKTNGLLTVQAVFDKVAQNNALGGVMINDATYTLTLLKADIDETKIERFTSVIVRGDQYQILEIPTDKVGSLVVLKIRRYK